MPDLSLKSVRALVQKEFRQHEIPFIALIMILFGVFGLMLLGTRISTRTLNLLVSESAFLMLFIPIGAIILSNRLVVKEYHGRTQLFVEALPISRVDMVAVKYVLGVTVLLCVAVITLGISAWRTQASDPVSARFLCILSLRSLVFCYFIWSFFFAMGFAGRFRIPIYLMLGFGVAIICMITDLDVYRTGPLALVRPDDFPLERYVFPVTQLCQTFLLGTGWLILAFILALMNEGSVAESLAKPMSQREKATMGVLIFGFILAAALLDGKREKAPYRFTSSAVIAGEKEPIEILYIHEGLRSEAGILKDHLEKTMSDLRKTLGLEKIPPVRIVYRDSLDKNKYETAKLEENDGVLIRANFADIKAWCIDDFQAYFIRAILDKTTRHRSRFDPKQWLCDGFSIWLAREGFRSDSDAHKMLLIRSIVAVKKQKLNPKVIRDWCLFQERFGEPFAEAVAYSGLAYLQDLKGPEVVVNLAKAVLGRIPPDDIRETIYERYHPMAAVFEEQTGENWETFLSGWNTWLDNLARLPEFQIKIDAIPEVTGYVDVETKEGDIRDIVYGFDFARIPDAGAVCALLHKKLPPFDMPLSINGIAREEKMVITSPDVKQDLLAGKYGKGERVFFALEYDSDILGVPVRILSKRMNLP